MPRCPGCLTEDVTVKLTDEHGCEYWFCAEDWEAAQQLHAKIMTLFEDFRSALDA